MAAPLIASVAATLNSSNTFSIRQKPTRLPYSCQAQFGTSGDGEPPAGGVRTVRGIGSFGFHSSTLMMIHTTSRAPPGSVSFGRSLIAEYGTRSLSIIKQTLPLQAVGAVYDRPQSLNYASCAVIVHGCALSRLRFADRAYSF